MLLSVADAKRSWTVGPTWALGCGLLCGSHWLLHTPSSIKDLFDDVAHVTTFSYQALYPPWSAGK